MASAPYDSRPRRAANDLSNKRPEDSATKEVQPVGTSHESTSVPSISVVIPTLDSERTIDACLASVHSQSRAALEIIVVDGGSRDDTVGIADRWGAAVVTGSFARSAARRKGAMIAKGDLLLFLDADQIIDAHVLQECAEIVGSSRTTVVTIPETDEATGFWLRCRVIDRLVSNRPENSYPRMFPRSLYWFVGGHTTSFENYMEDRDLYLRISRAGAISIRTQGRIVNILGVVNPVEIGIQGARAANDSRAYYAQNRSEGESFWKVLRPRIFGAISLLRERRGSASGWLALPVYIILAYGPRAVRVWWGSAIEPGFSRGVNSGPE